MRLIALVTICLPCVSGRRRSISFSQGDATSHVVKGNASDSLHKISGLFLSLGRAPSLSPMRLHSIRVARRPVKMHGSHHHHHDHHDHDLHHDGPGLKQPIAAAKNYIAGAKMQTFFVWWTIRRHLAGRRALIKEGQSRQAVRITWIGAAINLFLAFFKAFAGVVSHSSAMISDAAHSFSDLISDVLTLVTLRMASVPPDEDHPYGHGRFESLGSLSIAGLLAMAGVTFGASAFADLLQPTTMPHGKIALVAAVASIASKELLFRATDRIGRSLNSQMLIANAWHHRSDALSSIVALVGIAGGLLGLPILDPIAGLLVAGMVTTMGIRIGVEAMAQLTDTSDVAMADKLQAAAHGVPGVKSASQIRSRSMGGSYFVDMAIQVEPRLTASAAHKVGEEVRHAVLDAMPHVSEVLVHVDTNSHDFGCPLQDAAMRATRSHLEVEKQVRAEMMTLPELKNVTGILVHYLPSGLSIDVQAKVASNLQVKDLVLVADRAKQRLKSVSSDIDDVKLFVDLQSSHRQKRP